MGVGWGEVVFVSLCIHAFSVVVLAKKKGKKRKRKQKTEKALEKKKGEKKTSGLVRSVSLLYSCIH